MTTAAAPPPTAAAPTPPATSTCLRVNLPSAIPSLLAFGGTSARNDMRAYSRCLVSAPARRRQRRLAIAGLAGHRGTPGEQAWKGEHRCCARNIQLEELLRATIQTPGYTAR